MPGYDDGVREIAGVKGCRTNDPSIAVMVTINEQRARPMIALLRPEYDVLLTPVQARRLASQLTRLARRIDQRTEA